jgi:3-phenylpropionate/trans-cinnamate dioxygenase ferredoxin subunit
MVLSTTCMGADDILARARRGGESTPSFRRGTRPALTGPGYTGARAQARRRAVAGAGVPGSKGGSAMPRYIAVAQRSEVPDGSVRCVDVEGRKIALFHMGGNFYAIDDTCSHMGGSLSEGEIDGDEVVCPWHGAHFEIRTGEAASPPADIGVARFNVRTTGETVEIEVDE